MNEQTYYENKNFWKKEIYLENELELNRFMQCAKLIPDSVNSLVDVGTGNGAFLSYLETQNKPIKYLGIERSKAAIEARICQSNILQGSIEYLPFEDQSFDLVSALEVIEHLPYINYSNCLQEIERIAKNYILIAVPYCERRKNVECSYCGCNFNPIYHMRSFDMEKCKYLFKHFKLINHQILTRQVYLFSFLMNIKTSIFTKKNVMPSYTLCPQCGFSGSLTSDLQSSQNNLKKVHSQPSKFKNFIKSIWPKKEEEVWIINLYERSTIV